MGVWIQKLNVVEFKIVFLQHSIEQSIYLLDLLSKVLNLFFRMAKLYLLLENFTELQEPVLVVIHHDHINNLEL